MPLLPHSLLENMAQALHHVLQAPPACHAGLLRSACKACLRVFDTPHPSVSWQWPLR